MDKSAIYVSKTEALLEQLRKQIDFKVLKTEYVKEDGINYLRVYCDMDQPGGIGSDDCAKIARPLSKLLDKADFIEDDNYTLEVCSPGYLIPDQTEALVPEEESDPDQGEEQSSAQEEEKMKKKLKSIKI